MLEGISGDFGDRQAMAIFNLGWDELFFWDGRRGSKKNTPYAAQMAWNFFRTLFSFWLAREEHIPSIIHVVEMTQPTGETSWTYI